MFAADRDILALEPGLYGEIGWAGQRLLSTTGDVLGTTLTVPGAAADLTTLGIEAGMVAMIAGVPAEIVTVDGGMAATVSKLRPDVTDELIPPDAVTGATVEVMTLRPQLAIVHRQLVAMLGLVDGDVDDGEVSVSAVMDASPLVLTEALGAVHLALSAASAVPGPMSALGQRAELYRRRFEAERRRVVVRLDLDGDGEADATRRLNALNLVRM
ncbi:MAG: hypothetical protein AAGB51_13265 [Planctomycetota bacterium]